MKLARCLVTWIAIIAMAGGAVAIAAAQSSTANQAPVATIVAKTTDFCVGQRATTEIYDGSTDPNSDALTREWTFAGSPYGAEFYFTFAFEQAGSFELVLVVKDPGGASSRDARMLYVRDCAAPTASTQSDPTPTRDPCYDANGKYTCATAAPAPTAPSPACDELMRKREAWGTDWKYRKYQYYEENQKEFGSDAEYERRMQAEYDAYGAQWEAEWKNQGCEYGGNASGPSNDCQRRFEQAEPEFQALRDHYDAQKKQYYTELESARREFEASGPHTDEEWRQFESRWSDRAQSMSASFESDLKALITKYQLDQCGYNDAYRSDQEQEKFASTPPSATPYDDERAKCDARLEEIKAGYQSRFESLYARLRQTSEGTPEHEQALGEIRQLEKTVGEAMEEAVRLCREQYQQDYHEPGTYDDAKGSLDCYGDESKDRIVCRGKYVAFEGNPQTQVLYNYNCGGASYFDKLYANVVLEDFQLSEGEEGGQLSITAGKLRMILHDNPRGIVNVGTVGGATVLVVPAPYFDVTVDGNAVKFAGKEVAGLWVGGGPDVLKWDAADRTLSITGEAKWIAESCLPTGESPEGDGGDQYWDAIQKRKLGAQVVITDKDGKVGEDEESYSDIDVGIAKEDGKKYVATIDSEDGTCKTVVLKFDKQIFDTIKLKVVLQGKNADGSFSSVEIREADTLEDILDPCDDGADGFEYYIVQDKYGTQVLVSFAHFSEKRVSVEAASIGNIVIPGFSGALLAFAAVAGLALVGIRRRLTR